MKTSDKVQALVNYLQTNKVYEDQTIGSWSQDGNYYISLSGDYFFDRICGNGRMAGFHEKITITERGIIANEGSKKFMNALVAVFGQEALDAAIERNKQYWADKDTTDWRVREKRLQNQIATATI